ncbi:MAG: hypothetical protein IJU64_06450 [Bacilli bacterium]|nr:hypothetical protein [Bacilli bacterium]
MKKKIPTLVLALLGTSVLTACGCAFPFVPGGSDSPIESEFNAFAVAELVANGTSAYRSDVTASSLIEPVQSELTSTESSKKIAASLGDLVLLLHQGFAPVMPEKTGARSFQGYPASIDSIRLSGVTSSSQTYLALSWLVDKGLYVPNRNSTFYASMVVKEDTVNTYLNRIHAYIGNSKKDDFYTTVNRDFLYDNCPDEGKDATDSVYKTNLIPQSAINTWAKGLYDEVGAAKNFDATYLDFDRRKQGDSSGLCEAINAFLDDTTWAELKATMETMIATTGYCPLWSSSKQEKATPAINGRTYSQQCVLTTVYSNSARPSEILPGSSAFNESVERFTPIFSEVMGWDEATARKWATNYTYFKYYFAVARQENAALKGQAYQPSIASTIGASVNVYDLLKNGGVSYPNYFFFDDACDLASILDFATPDHLDYLKGMFVWQMCEHYIPCLPDGDAVMQWAHSSGGRHDEAGLTKDSVYGSYVIPYVSGNLSNYYVGTAEFAEDLSAIRTLVSDIKSTFSVSLLGQSSWASEDAKTKVRTKLGNMISVIGGAPDSGSPYLRLAPAYLSKEEGGTLYGNMGLYQKAVLDRAMDGAGSAPASSRSGQTEALARDYDALYANAFYVPWTNSIVITLGYLAAYPHPAKMSKEEFLAAYGWVVGHEISHGFDATGIYYDDSGTRKSTGYLGIDDLLAYNTRARAFEFLYSGVEVMPGWESDGSIVRDEAIADVTGLRINMGMAKSIPNFDYAKYFESAAKNFAAYASQAVYGSDLAGDEHPFGRVRVNQSFKVLDEFYSTFGIGEKDAMYVSPAERVYVW